MNYSMRRNHPERDFNPVGKRFELVKEIALHGAIFMNFFESTIKRKYPNVYIKFEGQRNSRKNYR